MGVCNCSMFCCTLLYVHSSIAIILMGKRERVALLNLSSWCLVMVERLFLAVPRGCLQFVIVVFSDHTHLLFQTDGRTDCQLCFRLARSSSPHKSAAPDVNFKANQICMTECPYDAVGCAYLIALQVALEAAE